MKSKVGSALIAIALAFGLWLYVITVISPDQTRPYYKVPVVLDNMDSLAEKQLMVVSDPNPLVTVELAGTRSDLNKINSANLTVVADLGTIDGKYRWDIRYPRPMNCSAALSRCREGIPSGSEWWWRRKSPRMCRCRSSMRAVCPKATSRVPGAGLHPDQDLRPEGSGGSDPSRSHQGRSDQPYPVHLPELPL